MVLSPSHAMASVHVQMWILQSVWTIKVNLGGKWGMVSQVGIDEGGMGEEGEGQRGKPLPPLSCMCAASVLPHV